MRGCTVMCRAGLRMGLSFFGSEQDPKWTLMKDELAQDCLVAAAESSGKSVTPGNVVFYVLQNAKAGRRAMSAT